MTIARPDVSVHARVRAAASALGPSEGRVAAVIMERPDEVVEWSAAEVAEAAGTSTATVIRACQSLGFRGFQHVRLELARSAPLAPRDPQEAARANTFDDAVDALRLAQERVDPARIDAATRALRRARRVVLVGNGFSGPPLQDLAMRMSGLGQPVEAPVDPLAQQLAVHSLTGDDLCLALSYSGANVQTLRAAAAASERGASLLLVTSYARSPLGRIADIVIATGPVGSVHDLDPYLARLGHTVVLHALHRGLAERTASVDVADMGHVVADALSED